MVFCIMELGYIAFQTIVTHHAAYECARIGSLWAGSIDTNYTSPRTEYAKSKAADQLKKMLRNARFSRFTRVPHRFSDPQTRQTNADLVVEVENPIRLIFPGSSYMFSQPKGSGTRRIRASVRMPIEQPLTGTFQ
jgi:hypothetical protein